MKTKAILTAVLLCSVLIGCIALSAPVIAESPSETTELLGTEVSFSTTDRKGNPVTDEIYEEYELIILNFWEPWCGPCVFEMPDLEKISQEYAEKGVLILGIYRTPHMEDDVEEVLKYTGVTYPILHYAEDFQFLQTGYVPTTVILDGSGTIVKEPFAGAMRYQDWAALIEELL